MLEEFKLNINKFSNEKLCEIIVTHRYLGIMRDEAICCMEELAARRVAGDVFKFEDRIKELLEGLPKIDLDLNKILKNTRIF